MHMHMTHAHDTCACTQDSFDDDAEETIVLHAAGTKEGKDAPIGSLTAVVECLSVLRSLDTQAASEKGLDDHEADRGKAKRASVLSKVARLLHPPPRLLHPPPPSPPPPPTSTLPASAPAAAAPFTGGSPSVHRCPGSAFAAPRRPSTASARQEAARCRWCTSP